MVAFKDIRTPMANAAVFISTPILRVCVGREGKGQATFMIHEGAIRPRSEFFQIALNGNWRESDDRTVSLPEDDPATFALYVTIVYTGAVPVHGDNQFDPLTRLYVLAEKLMDVETKNLVIQAMIARGRENFFPTASLVHILYSGTPESSPARRLFRDLFIHLAPFEAVLDKTKDWPYEFLDDIAMELLSRQRASVRKLRKEYDLAGYVEKDYSVKSVSFKAISYKTIRVEQEGIFGSSFMIET